MKRESFLRLIRLYGSIVFPMGLFTVSMGLLFPRWPSPDTWGTLSALVMFVIGPALVAVSQLASFRAREHIRPVRGETIK